MLALLGEQMSHGRCTRSIPDFVWISEGWNMPAWIGPLPTCMQGRSGYSRASNPTMSLPLAFQVRERGAGYFEVSSFPKSSCNILLHVYLCIFLSFISSCTLFRLRSLPYDLPLPEPRVERRYLHPTRRDLVDINGSTVRLIQAFESDPLDWLRSRAAPSGPGFWSLWMARRDALWKGPSAIVNPRFVARRFESRMQAAATTRRSTSTRYPY